MLCTVTVSCPIFPSEDPERVAQAVLNIFPDAVLEISENAVNAEAGSMDHFSMQIRKQRILDSARSVLMKGRRGERSFFDLNKQAAFAGKISFAEPRTVLGTIKVTASADDITSFIEILAPKTVEGEEVRI